MYNILSTMFTSIGESKIPLGLLIFSSILNIVMDLWMVAGLGLGVFGAALATLIAEGIYHCLYDHHSDRHGRLLQNRGHCDPKHRAQLTPVKPLKRALVSPHPV